MRTSEDIFIMNRFILSIIFIYVTLLSIFNVEARLPKYMAPRAAELLIEASKLDFSVEYKQTISGILSNVSFDDNEVVTEQILGKVGVTKDDFGSCYDVCKSMIAKKVKEYNTTEKSKKDQITESITKASYACKLVDFLYSTEKRQHLANWMKNRIERGKIKTVHVTDEEGTVNHFIDLFNSISEVYNDNGDFRTFVNQHFPCWTGTMTCFMLNSEAHKILAQGNAVDLCRTKLSTTKITHKIVSILFVFELIDNWNDIKQICKIGVETDDSSRLNVPSFEEIDPYDCVPVPNTAYEIENIYNGICLLSTTRNLLCILKGRAPNFDNFNIKTEIIEYLKKFESLEQLTAIPGINNIDEQNRWAGTLLAIRNVHFPDLKGFIDTLIGLIKHITPG